MRRRFTIGEPELRLPRPPDPPPSPTAFALVSPSCLPPLTPDQWLGVIWVYQKALEQAQAVVRPSLPERDLLGVWN